MPREPEPAGHAIPEPLDPTPRPRGSYERWRWQIFAVTWLAYAGFYLTRKSFAVAKIGIQQDPLLRLTDAQMAWIDGAYLVAYAAGQFLFGIAGDRAGTRKVVSTGLFVSVLAAVAMGASTWTVMLGLFFLIQGLCQSSGWAPLTKNMSAFFSRRERGTVMGLWCTNYALGGLLASMVAGLAGDRWGWRYAFFVPAAGLTAVWVLFLLFQRNRPEDVGLPPIEQYHGEVRGGAAGASAAAAEEPGGSWRAILEVLTNPMVLLLAAVYFLLKPARYAILFWGPKYIHARLGSGMTESGLLSGLFELAGPAAALAGGYLSDRVFGTRRVPVCVICLVLLGVLLIAFNHFPVGRWALGISFFVIGMLLFAPDSLVVGASAVDFGTRQGASTAAGIINGMGSVGAVFGGVLPGFFNERWGWSGVFGLLGAMTLLAGLILLPRWNALPTERKPPPPPGGFPVAGRT
ncbi:MAG: MFS transporter [Phycisphaerae bacterium]|jgi:OPA family sugar phosphate sensor protein UhpC-like MFS transporter